LGACTLKIWKSKNLKNEVQFWTALTLTANILVTDRDIENWKQNSSRTISTGSDKNLASYGPLTKKLEMQMLTPPKSTMHARSTGYANAFEFKPGDFATSEISTPSIFPQSNFMAPGRLMLGFAAPNFQMVTVTIQNSAEKPKYQHKHYYCYYLFI